MLTFLEGCHAANAKEQDFDISITNGTSSPTTPI